MIPNECDRCGRGLPRKTNPEYDQWNLVFSQGYVTGLICPTCQTDEENAEAVINEATIDYSKVRQDAFGRWVR